MPLSDSRSDEELVAAANAGESAVFEALYARYREWVLRVAYRFTQDRDEALDVLQETFLYLLRRFPGFRLTSRMTTFLYPAVRSIALTQRRKRTREGGADLGEDAEYVASRPAADEARQDLEDLAGVLSTLPERQREVLLMRFVDGMSLAEVAVALEIPVGTVKSRLHNALRTLRDDERTRRYFEP